MEIYPFIGPVYIDAPQLSVDKHLFFITYRYYKGEGKSCRQELRLEYHDPLWKDSSEWRVIYLEAGHRITFATHLRFDEAYALAHEILLECVLGVDESNSIVFTDLYAFPYHDARYVRVEDWFKSY